MILAHKKTVSPNNFATHNAGNGHGLDQQVFIVTYEQSLSAYCDLDLLASNMVLGSLGWSVCALVLGKL